MQAIKIQAKKVHEDFQKHCFVHRFGLKESKASKADNFKVAFSPLEL